jgi:predicted PurR-regulated permease PerM
LLLGIVGALLAVPLTIAGQKLILEADDSTIWLAELMSVGEPEGTEAEPEATAAGG